MNNQENHNKLHRKRSAAAMNNEPNQTERTGLWVGFGAAAVVTIGVLGLALYTNHQDTKMQSMDIENVVVQEASHILPISEAEAEHIALNRSETQSKGMVAPADTADTEIAAASETPTNVILADNRVAADEAHAVKEDGVVKFYFASGKSQLADGIVPLLQEITQGVKEGKTAVISGFADQSGNTAINERLSKERAQKVRDALLAMGIPENSIQMKRPQNITGSGAKEESRRVEVVLE